MWELDLSRDADILSRLCNGTLSLDEASDLFDGPAEIINISDIRTRLDKARPVIV